MPHPIRSCAATVQAALKSVADVQPLFMSPTDKAAALHELHAAAAQVAELQLRVLAAAEDLADQSGAKDAAGWLAATLPVDRRAAHADLRLGRELETWQQLRAGLAAGTVSIDQARSITGILKDLPDELDADTLAKAEAEMVRLAAVHSPAELRRLGVHLLTVIDPDRADELEAKRLADQERRALEDTRLHLKPLGDGRLRFSGIVSEVVGTRFRTVLESFAQPRKAALDADGRTQPRSRLLGLALGDLLESLDPKRLPLHGGDATSVMVTISLDDLRKQLATATVEGTTSLTATEARRLACTATIIPAVLGGKSEVLDLGRSARLFTPSQRKALRLRHPQCQTEGCTVPARWCEAHHEEPWSQGGTTNLGDGALLCTHHHHRAHDPAYDTTRHTNGDYRFHRRT